MERKKSKRPVQIHFRQLNQQLVAKPGPKRAFLLSSTCGKFGTFYANKNLIKSRKKQDILYSFTKKTSMSSRELSMAPTTLSKTQTRATLATFTTICDIFRFYSTFFPIYFMLKRNHKKCEIWRCVVEGPVRVTCKEKEELPCQTSPNPITASNGPEIALKYSFNEHI